MIHQTPIITDIIIENSAVTLLDRIKGHDGSYITKAGIDSITCKVIDLNDPTNADSSGSPISPTIDVDDSVFDTLQTDGRWVKDTTGYNFAAELSGDNFPQGNRTYRVEIKFVPVTGYPFYVLYNLECVNIFSE
jgi:hypothetical protein